MLYWWFILITVAPSLWADSRPYLDRLRQWPWLRTARVFLLDAYQYPFAPKLEFDAEATARLLEEMRFNVIRFPAIGMYATLQGVRFPVFPGQGSRDLLAEMVRAAKPRNIRVVVYVGTGHKLAWSIVTKHHPEYGQRTTPGGLPDRTHFFTGEDFGTVCWNTPYRQAYMDMLRRIVRDYDVDGIYFDRWTPQYFWPGLKLCYCDGCRKGFRSATGLELPYRDKPDDYTESERRAIARYHDWYREELVKILQEARRIVKSHKDIPLIANIRDPNLMANEDPRFVEPLDAFLYERSNSLLERAEGVSLVRAAGYGVWPYVGSYHNWPRVAEQGYDYSQEIYTTIAFGGCPIVAQPTGYLTHAENRRFVSEPFTLLALREQDHREFENTPYVGVVWSDRDPPGFAQTGRFYNHSARLQSMGAFAACLQRHVQVSSLLERTLDEPVTLARYPVLYLPAVVHVSPRRVEQLKRFVASGGTLIVSYRTSLYDADGRLMPQFTLEELVRVRPRKRDSKLAEFVHTYSSFLGGPNDLYLLARTEGELGRGRWRGRLVPLWHYEPVEVLEGGTVLMDIVTGDDTRRVLPGVVHSRYGKGRVLYLATAIESLFAENSEKVLGDLIRDLILLAATAPPPYELEAPASLVANLTQAGERRVLHLVNWTGNEARRRFASLYYLPPVEGATLRLPGNVKDVSCYPIACPTPQRKHDRLEIRLPRIHTYLAVTWRMS